MGPPLLHRFRRPLRQFPWAAFHPRAYSLIIAAFRQLLVLPLPPRRPPLVPGKALTIRSFQSRAASFSCTYRALYLSLSLSSEYFNLPHFVQVQPTITCSRGLMGDTMSCFEDQKKQSPNISSAIIDHQVKQENSASSYNHMYGPPNNDQQDFHLGFAAKPLSRSWSSTALLSSPAGSCDTATETTSVRSFSKNNKPGTRNPHRDRPYECNSKANGGAHKKARVQPSSAQSTIKVRKEKLGDRIAALHQLVSPFGKTDTASVLSEAIGYIRFLRSQIYALSSPYLDHGLGNPNHHNSEEEMELTSDLRIRGLCLVPTSCILQVSETNVMSGGADCWPAAASFGDGGIVFP
ncbi:hypothetical protein SAY86_013713 [Trapa natans]|uniref:BHLH domain-containing protein n=1 Tax=Trapa natans TaxID=22666 RepID=A0AAN7KWX0_TRANT|nr:hypothetical protein SAY86_013713 [Trapa natans]